MRSSRPWIRAASRALGSTCCRRSRRRRATRCSTMLACYCRPTPRSIRWRGKRNCAARLPETSSSGLARAVLPTSWSKGAVPRRKPGPERMASVHIRNAEKYFGGTHVIRGVSIDIADGEFAVLVGPSGCGKSTLLRMIAGLEEITGGEIEIGGRVVNTMQPKERDIAMVFQNYALYPHMTVRDNMAFSMLLAKRPRSEIDERVGQAAAILGLAQLLDRYPRQLSGGP